MKVIVDLQILVDYLDNLCDRMGVLEQKTFRILHAAYLAALGVGETTDYYQDFPAKEDRGYLDSLVCSCRSKILSWPNTIDVQGLICKYSRLYCDLQVYKHCRTEDRIPALVAWYDSSVASQSFSYWWEFAAASGSTLLIFYLLAIAHGQCLGCRTECPEGGAVNIAALTDIVAYYFTTLAPLHILLDYLIDREEDQVEGDLNLVAFYPSEDMMVERILNYYQGAIDQSFKQPNPRFHRFIARALIGLYLSDAKIFNPTNQRVVQKILQGLDPQARLLQKVCLKGRKNIFNLSERDF